MLPPLPNEQDYASLNKKLLAALLILSVLNVVLNTLSGLLTAAMSWWSGCAPSGVAGRVISWLFTT